MKRKYAVGDVVRNWEVLDIVHFERRDRPGTKEIKYMIRCSNCQVVVARLGKNVQMSRCQNCSLMPRGLAGLNKIYKTYRENAAVFARDFTLSLEEFAAITSSVCYYCGTPPVQRVSTNDYSPALEPSQWGVYWYNGIDRVDNEQGYVLSNCIPCCQFCNRAKHALTYEEFSAHWKFIYQRFANGERPSVLTDQSRCNTSILSVPDGVFDASLKRRPDSDEKAR